MSRRVEKASQKVYSGLWGVLTAVFRVPDQPPTLPTAPGETATWYHPAEGYLRYLKLHFWVGLVMIDVAIFAAWIVLVVLSPVAGALLALPALAVAVLPDIVAYLALHLLYDTTWYVLTNRSLRIRRGVMVIREMTITFENVQNVSVSQGPLERYFGIANVVVETAGGGVVASQNQGAQRNPLHRGLIAGIDNAWEVRKLIMSRLGRSGTAGLGDEEAERPVGAAGWSAEHVAALREIRDGLARVVGRGTGPEGITS